MFWRKNNPRWWRRWQKLYAKEEYVEALELLDDLSPEEQESGFASYALGDTYVGLGRLDEAREHYERARVEFPESHLAYSRIGELLLRQEKYGEAMVFCKRAYSLKPDDPNNQYNLAWCHMQLDEIERAQEFFSSLFESSPDDLRILYAKAHLCYAFEQYTEALEALQVIKATDPAYPGIENLLAITLYRLERYSEAIPYLEKRYGKLPDDKDTISTLYHSYVQTDSHKKALDMAIIWRKHEDEEGDSDVMMLKPLRKLGQTERALELALELDEKFPDSEDILVELANLQHGTIPESEYQALVERIRKLDPEMIDELEPPLE